MVRQQRYRVGGTGFGLVAAAVLLAGCGSSDNPISSAPGVDRPLTGSSATSTSTPRSLDFGPGSPEASASGSAAPTPDAGGIGAPSGVLVSGKGFTVRMPAQPEQSAQTAKGDISFDIYRYAGPDATWTLTRGYYPKIGTLPSLSEALHSAAGQAGGKLASSSMLKYSHHPAIEGVITGVTLDGHAVSIFARYVVVDRVMYGLLYLDRAAGTTFTPAFTAFVESLTLS